MGSLIWLVYLAGVCSGIKTISIILMILSIIWGIIGFIGICDEDSWGSLGWEEGVKLYSRPWLRQGIISTLICASVAVVTPSKETVTTIAALGVAGQVIENSETLQQLPEKTFKAVDTLLDSYIKEAGIGKEDSE